MTELPGPLTPPDCDLRGSEWMPFHGHKLYGSDFDAIATDAEYRAAQRIWWVSWQQQVPAASLPNDDRVMAHAAGYGRDLKGWAKIKTVALHGFIECSDGRLYHRFLAEEALVAWEKRKESNEAKDGTRERQKRHREERKRMFDTLRSRGVSVPWDATTTQLKDLLSRSSNADDEQQQRTCHSDSNAPDTAKTRQDRTRQDKERTNTSYSPDPADPAQTRKGFFDEVTPLVRELTGQEENPARAFIGVLLRDASDDDERVRAAVAAAYNLRPADPKAWMRSAIIKKPLSVDDRMAALIADQEQPSLEMADVED